MKDTIEILRGAEEVGFFKYWLKPMFYNLFMFKTGYVYRQLLTKEFPGGVKYVPGIGLITRRYLKKESI